VYPEGGDVQWLLAGLDGAQAQDLDERHLRAALGALRAEPADCEAAAAA
jgi:hypothetical protein